MKIIYTAHLEERLKQRQIDYNLPLLIFNESRERYSDSETGHLIAIMEVEIYNKKRDVLLAYTVEGDNIKLLTVHPLKPGQKDDRVTSGRWRKI